MAGGPLARLSCPACGGAVEPPRQHPADVAEVACPHCGGRFRVRRRSSRSGEVAAVRPPGPEPRVVGGLGLALRGAGLRGLEGAYRLGTACGATLLFACGGFVPVLGGWLRDEVSGLGGVVEALGGVRVRTETSDPDADLGPTLARADASTLFDEVAEVARRLGARPPEQLRLTYLPCCGVVAWRRSQALLIGLPLLHVLTVAELRSVLAHELSHLARGDATRSARSARFVESLGQALDRPSARPRGPLGLWARACRRLGDRLVAPIARGQEARADRAAGSLGGGTAAAAALVKVAQVQPLFREVLAHYDPADARLPNLYAFFRSFWGRLPAEVHIAIRHDLLTHGGAPTDGGHPPLLDRIAVVQAYPDRAPAALDHAPAAHLLGDIEAMEQMLHNRLFAVAAVEPSVFHRAGT